MRFILIILSCLLTLWPASLGSNAPSTDKIMERVDSIFSPNSDFSMRVTVTDKNNNKPQRVTRFKLLAKGRDQTLLMTLAPESNRGRNLLFNGLDFWIFLPSVRRPFRISLQERLTGEAANADLARANYSRDYNPRLVGIEKLGETRCYQLDLLAKSNAVPYYKVSMWVKTGTFAPIKAGFYASSGRLLKECFYEDYRLMLGAIRPTRLVLKNSVDQGKTTILQYSDWKEEPLPLKFFDKSYIDKTKY